MLSETSFFILKTIVSGGLIALVSSIAKYFPKWAALLTALPLVTFLSLLWIYSEHKDLKLIETYATDVLIWTLPSLVFFVVFILLLRFQTSFFLSLLISTLTLMGLVFILNRFHILK